MKRVSDYYDFYFNGRSLSSLGGKIIHQYDAVDNLVPNKNVETLKIPGRDGEIVVCTNYEPREWQIDVYFENITGYREIAKWLSSKQESEFYYIGDTVKIKAMIKEVVETEIKLGENGNDFCGTLTLKFRAHDPFYYVINDKHFEITTVGLKKFINDGNEESLPKLRFQLVGIQNLKFKLNDDIYEVKSCKDWLHIDSERRLIKDSIGIKRNDFTCNGSKIKAFPNLKVGENTFELLLGSIRNLIIECHSRYI